MRSRWRDKTIWGESFLSEVPERYRSLYTVFIPLNHLLLAGFGVLEANEVLRGIQVPVVLALSFEYAVIWTAAVWVLAAVALVALIRRFEAVEVVATIVLVVAAATYPLAELVLVSHGDLSHSALLVGLPMFLLIPVWRVFDLVRTARRRGWKRRA